MGTGASRREPEVHVVVVQSQENGKMEAKVLRRSYPASIKRERERVRKDSQEGQCVMTVVYVSDRCTKPGSVMRVEFNEDCSFG